MPLDTLRYREDISINKVMHLLSLRRLSRARRRPCFTLARRAAITKHRRRESQSIYQRRPTPQKRRHFRGRHYALMLSRDGLLCHAFYFSPIQRVYSHLLYGRPQDAARRLLGAAMADMTLQNATLRLLVSSTRASRDELTH